MANIFFKPVKTFALEEILSIIDILEIQNAENIHNLHSIIIKDVNTLDNAGPHDISFFSNLKYIHQLKNTNAAFCVVPIEAKDTLPQRTIALVVKNPHLEFAKIASMFYNPRHKIIEPRENYNQIQGSLVHKTAKIGHNLQIGQFSVIEKNAHIGDNVKIFNNVTIGENCIIEKDCIINSNVSIEATIMSSSCVVLSGAKIGQEGFGFAKDNDEYIHIPQIGQVIIGKNVLIGANTTIDRGSIGDTIISNNCMIDNLVQIAHNVEIGSSTIIAAQTGIAGSSKIGKGCTIGGQAGFVGHISVGNYVQVAAKSGVTKNIDSNQIIGGHPAQDLLAWQKQQIYLRKNIK